MDLARFQKLPIMGILRGIELDAIEPLVDTALASGLETIEITMNTKRAADLIRSAVSRSSKKLTIGAGTVLNLDSLKIAFDAGATFIVTPVLVEDVVAHCVKNKIPVFPGAFSPQEIYRAWNTGAAMVKVFPAKMLGPEYFREIKGPFDQIKLLACGGVTPENLQAYFSQGADAISFGASVFKQEWLKTRDFKSIKQSIERYIQQFKSLGN